MREVDGFEVEYPHRNSWKVDRYRLGIYIDTIPVVWDDDILFHERILIVLYQNDAELRHVSDNKKSLIVAVAKPRNYESRIRSAGEFQCIYGVLPTGETGMSRNLEGIKCRILKKYIKDQVFEF